MLTIQWTPNLSVNIPNVSHQSFFRCATLIYMDEQKVLEKEAEKNSSLQTISKWKKFFSKKVITIFVAIALALLLLIVIKPQKTPPPFVSKDQANYHDNKQGNGLFGQCEGKGTSKLNTLPKALSFSKHATFVVNIELFKEPVEAAYRKDPYQENYLVVFEHSCDFYTRLIHIDTLSDKVNSSFSFKNPNDQHPYASVRIPVEEGEVIGTVGPHSFDFQIMDATVKNTDILMPENIDWFSSYTVDTFDYLSAALHSQLLQKNLRKTEPLGGKVGYDKDGTLLGNWFKVGRDPNKRDEYWTQNLSIVYDHIDESQIRISLGNFDGYPKAFGIRGNTPDPKDVTKSSGIVKYELMKFDYYQPDGSKWDTISYVSGLTAKNTSEMAGVVLFELQNDGKLKLEVFPRVNSADQVTDFTSKALIYER